MKTFESIDLKELEGELCFGGIDLASTTDMSVFSVMFPPNELRHYYPDKYIFKSWVYLPEIFKPQYNIPCGKCQNSTKLRIL